MSTAGGVTIADLQWQPGNEAGAEPHFDGEVRRSAVLQRPNVTISVVQFVDGARTYWHTHPEEQILVVLEGDCRLRTRTGEEQIARQGQVVHLPPGEEHWHGAVPGSTMTHLSITTGGPAVWNGPPTPR